MTETTPPNVLFVIWDACRLDAAREHANFLNSLAADNLTFENAITPASWSLPSHASLFTGQYAHEHDIYRASDSMDGVTLFERLHDRGYKTYGVSGNGFVSHARNLHRHVDELYYSSGQGPFIDGLTVYSHVFGRQNRNQDLDAVDASVDLLRAIANHDHPLKSLGNLSAVGLNRVAANFPPLQRLPHPVFNPFQPFSYSPKKNTAKLREYLSDAESTRRPFFMFANYMDAHRPYYPPEEYQRAHLGRKLPYDEVRRLTDDVTDPWEFAEGVAAGSIDEADLETVRGLYTGEVQSLDDHLELLFAELERRGLREDTLVVVTADHGENLGEADEMGKRRMGHHSSMSDVLLRVPLVVAHPDLEGRSIEDVVSTKALFDLFTGGHEDLLASGGRDLSPLLPEDGVVTSQYPAVGGEELYDRYPNAPRDVLAERVEDSAVAGYTEEWRMVVDSTGLRRAWHDGSPADAADAPDRLVEACDDQLEALVGGDAGDALTEDEIEHLESLGYI